MFYLNTDTVFLFLDPRLFKKKFNYKNFAIILSFFTFGKLRLFSYIFIFCKFYIFFTNLALNDIFSKKELKKSLQLLNFFMQNQLIFN